MKFCANSTSERGLQIFALALACILIFSGCDGNETSSLISPTVPSPAIITTIVSTNPVETPAITSGPSFGVITSTPKLTTPAIFKVPQSIDDIPLPPQARKENGNWWQTGAHEVSVTFSVPESIFPTRTEIYAFFQQELPPLGWKPCRNASCEDSLATWSDSWYESYRFGAESGGPILQIQTNMTYNFEKKIQGEGGGFFTLHFLKK